MGWQDAPLLDAPAGKAAWESAPLVEEGGMLQHAKNLAGGLVRGAGSFGATVIDAARGLGSAVVNATPADMRPHGVTDVLEAPRGGELRAGMDSGLQTLGADPHSAMYGAGKIGAEIAGTAGVGGALAKGAQAVGAAPAVIEALATGGMRAGGVTGAGGLALRAGAGAANGAVAAGAVDPASAAEGAVVGAAIPTIVKGVGAAAERVMHKAGSAGAAPLTQKLETARAGAQEGYVVPPADLNPGILSKVASGFSGKIKTSQEASARNQQITNNLARRSLGLGSDVQITPEVLDNLRAEAGKAYGAVSELGAIPATGPVKLPPSVNVKDVTDKLTFARSRQVDSGELVNEWRQANHDATGYYRAYARDANPETLAKAKTAATAAKQIDAFLDAKLQAMGKGDMLQALKDARVKIAKSYDVEKALNGSTGDVSTPAIVRSLQKGRPLTGELETIGRFGQTFPKATQSLKEAPGAVSPLDILFASGAGMASGPLGAAAALSRPVVRAALLSGPVQRRAMLDPAPANPLIGRTVNHALPAVARALPVLFANP